MNISQLLEALKNTNISLTIGEKLLAGASVAILSMVVVFIVLVLISGIISLIQKSENNKIENKSVNINEVKKEPELIDIKQEINSEEIVAAITAAICASNGGKQIAVKKIRRTNNTKSSWESMSKNITK